MSDPAAIARYSAASIVVVALSGWLLSMAFSMPGSRRALAIAAAVAVVVQVLGFVLARRAHPAQRIVGWAAGAGISLLTLVVFGFVARSNGMPLEPALFGLATFLFATELIEPFFLK